MPSNGSEKKGDILLVDDDKSIRITFRRILESAGYRVFTAKDVEAAKEWLGSRRFDAVLMDILMPGQSGLEALNYIKKMDKNLPVILVTGDSSLDYAIQAVKDKAYDYLRKPVSKDELLNGIHRAVEIRRIMEERNEFQKQNEEYMRELEKKLSEKERELNLTNDALHHLLKFHEFLSEKREPKEVLKEAVKAAKKITGGTGQGVFLLTEKGKYLTLVEEEGIEETEELKILPSDEGMPGYVLKVGEAVYIPNVTHAPLKRSVTQKLVIRGGILSAMGAPIKLFNKIYGILMSVTTDPVVHPLRNKDILSLLCSATAFFLSRYEEEGHYDCLPAPRRIEENGRRKKED